MIGTSGRHDGMETKKGRERDEDADRKSKRRPLGWIVNRKQTAKCCTEHPCKSRGPLAKALQRFRFVVVSVEHGKQFCDHQQVLNSIR
jgi:hypothetical protein